MLGVHGVQNGGQLVAAQPLIQCFTNEHAQILCPSSGNLRSCLLEQIRWDAQCDFR